MKKDWDSYFMGVARNTALMSTCDRKVAGAILVKNRTILSFGYTGSVRDLPHCDEVGHDMVNGHCVRTIHAEANTIALAARDGVNVHGATLYVTTSPCWSCFKLAINAGIRRIVFDEFCRDDRVFLAAQSLGISISCLNEPEEPKEKQLRLL